MHRPHYFPFLVVWAFASLLLLFLIWRYRKHRPTLIFLLLAGAWMTFGVALSPVRISQLFPRAVNLWGRAGFIIIAVCVVFGAIIEALWLTIPRFDPKRREMLKRATLAAPAIALGVGFVKRDDLRLVEMDIPVAGLPKDLEGLRIVQISDLHLSELVSESLVARAVDMANSTRAHLALVTGDLISLSGDPLDACIRQIARLKSDSGVYGCMGNHEIYADCEKYVQDHAAAVGIPFLRSENRILQFGSAKFNLAGVDYQRRNSPYLEGAEKLVVPGMPNILLSHNPDVFPVAAAKGYDLTIAGHTHGGQINVEILHKNMNVARFFTPYVYGLYRHGKAAAFVTRGVGTIGIPSRLGAPPEVALLRLCATSS